MIKFSNIETYGWEAAIRGMRNPKNSWNLSDSKKCEVNSNLMCIGENDLKLMRILSNAGNDHGKFLRMIIITLDITAPLYWWKEFDTYKIGTVADSCSTMHKINSKRLTIDDFSHEHLVNTNIECLNVVIDNINWHMQKFNETGDKNEWWQIIQMLPSSFNQKRTIQLNYQVAKVMYNARKDHKLDEWHTFCDMLLKLPYFKDICINRA